MFPVALIVFYMQIKQGGLTFFSAGWPKLKVAHTCKIICFFKF